MHRHHATLPLLLLAVACAETAPANCADHPEREACVEACRRNPTDPLCSPADDAGTDSGAADSGAADSGTDAGPCGLCEGGLLCDPSTGDCVQCLGHDDCDGATPVCDPDAHTCVQCLGHDDCTDPAAAQCDDSHTCVPCTMDNHCTQGDRRFCAEGTCVQCDADSETAACADKVCDIEAGTCSDADPRSAIECEPCLSDLHCEDGLRCVPLNYKGAPHGNFCLPVSPCARPFSIRLSGRESLSGVAGDYCGINEALTTCEAVRALLDDTICDSDGPGGPDGGGGTMPCPEGGLCRDFGAAGGNRCTYECGMASQCLDPVSSPSGSRCVRGSGTDPDYCGPGR